MPYNYARGRSLENRRESDKVRNTVSDLMLTDKSFKKYVKDIEQMLVSAKS